MDLPMRPVTNVTCADATSQTIMNASEHTVLEQ